MKNEQCSMVSNPAFSAPAMPSAAWACAAIGRPCACASSAAAFSSAGPYWTRWGRTARRHLAAGDHHLDSTCAPRLACSRTASRTACSPLRLAAQDRAVPAGRGDRRARREDLRAFATEPEFERQVVAVAQVADRRDARGEVLAGGGPHPVDQPWPLQRGHQVGARVEGQVDVAVDQAGQHRDVAQVGRGGGGGGVGGDGGDPPVLDDHHLVVAHQLAVEQTAAA